MLKACYQHEWIEAGCDEAGRGPLAGPGDRRSRHFTPRMEPSAAQRLEKNEREKPQLASNGH